MSEDSMFQEQAKGLAENYYPLNQKMDRILYLLEKQETRAKRAVFWKMFWLFMFFILPLFLSYIFMSKLNLNSMSGMVKNLPGITGLNTEALK